MRSQKICFRHSHLMPVLAAVLLVELPHVALSCRNFDRLVLVPFFPFGDWKLSPSTNVFVKCPHEAGSRFDGGLLKLIQHMPIRYVHLMPFARIAVHRGKLPHQAVPCIFCRWMICTVRIPIINPFLAPFLSTIFLAVPPHHAFTSRLCWWMKLVVYLPIWNKCLLPHALTIHCVSRPHESRAGRQIRCVFGMPSRNSLLLPVLILVDPHQTVASFFVRRPSWTISMPIVPMHLVPSQQAMLLCAFPHEASTCRKEVLCRLICT
mmetsp:Transcript_44418/g.70579  ORF Transcript_44418/g.70579 Transcript_44418/m.70579 type:complete len:264 (+) Transcript_44418:393-1184(+)